MSKAPPKKKTASNDIRQVSLDEFNTVIKKMATSPPVKAKKPKKA